VLTNYLFCSGTRVGILKLGGTDTKLNVRIFQNPGGVLYITAKIKLFRTIKKDPIRRKRFT